jgi:hypothetical protein
MADAAAQGPPLGQGDPAGLAAAQEQDPAGLAAAQEDPAAAQEQDPVISMAARRLVHPQLHDAVLSIYGLLKSYRAASKEADGLYREAIDNYALAAMHEVANDPYDPDVEAIRAAHRMMSEGHYFKKAGERRPPAS